MIFQSNIPDNYDKIIINTIEQMFRRGELRYG